MTILAVHGHFYQPDRRDPRTGEVPPDPTAAPAPDWNERVAVECYRPNALLGNFARIGWDVGPTLALWLRRHHPDVAATLALTASPTLPPRVRSGGRPEAPGFRGAMAAGFHHAILPLALPRDRRTEIVWGIADFTARFGRAPAGFWLPECAVDLDTLADLADAGIGYVILAPWQGIEVPDTRRPYRVELGAGRRIMVMFYEGGLSGSTSFDAELTKNADRFVAEQVVGHGGPTADGGEPIVLLATDGELYGHHRPFTQYFLAALPAAAERAGVDYRVLGELLAEIDVAALPEVGIAERSSWSCHHGTRRWGETATDPAGALLAGPACDCTGESGWKPALRVALSRLADRLDAASEAWFAERGLDFWAIRDRYAPVAAGLADPRDYAWAAIAGSPLADDDPTELAVRELLDAARSRLAAFTSCAWFWEDPSRGETLTALRYAAHAIETVRRHTGLDAEGAFLADLAALASRHTGERGDALYRRAAAR